MIRYDTDAAKLLAAITAIDAKWQTKTKARTKKFIKAGAFAEKSSLWSTVKPVYMRLQWFKCVFCERQFLLISVATLARPDAAHDVSTDPKRGQWNSERKVLMLNPRGRRQTKKYRAIVRMPWQVARWLDDDAEAG